MCSLRGACRGEGGFKVWLCVPKARDTFSTCSCVRTQVHTHTHPSCPFPSQGKGLSPSRHASPCTALSEKRKGCCCHHESWSRVIPVLIPSLPAAPVLVLLGERHFFIVHLHDSTKSAQRMAEDVRLFTSCPIFLLSWRNHYVTATEHDCQIQYTRPITVPRAVNQMQVLSAYLSFPLLWVGCYFFGDFPF